MGVQTVYKSIKMPSIGMEWIWTCRRINYILSECGNEEFIPNYGIANITKCFVFQLTQKKVVEWAIEGSERKRKRKEERERERKRDRGRHETIKFIWNIPQFAFITFQNGVPIACIPGSAGNASNSCSPFQWLIGKQKYLVIFHFFRAFHFLFE